MFKKILSLTLVLLLLASTVLAFSDVSLEDWFYNDVMDMAAAGVINGMSDGRFAPQDELTVAAAIKLAVASRTSYYGEPAIQIDSSGGHWVSAYYSYAKEHGMLKGLSFQASDYDSPITRGQMATLFANTLDRSDYTQINDINNSALKGETNASAILLYNAGVLIGSNNGFDLNKNITRAETAAIINRVTNPSVRKDTGTLHSAAEEDSTFEAYQIEMLDLVNASRLAEGRGILTLDADLCQAAEQLAIEYSQTNQVHKRADGRHTGTVWQDLGLALRVHSENYGRDFASCSAYHNWMMNSSTHHTTLMGSSHTLYGIAKVTANGHTYWVELFSDNNLILTEDQSTDTGKDSQNSIEETGDYTFSDYQLETLELVNASRAELGLEPLILDEQLCKVAEELASDYSKGSKAHKRLNGKMPDSVLPEWGLPYRTIKENYANGTVGAASSAVDAHNVWMNSEIHRKEIVSKTHKYIGIGKVESNGYIYWVAVYSPN